VSQQEIALKAEDIEIRLQAKEGWAAAQGPGCVVVLATELTDELIREGMARDMVRLIQEQRKRVNCDYTDRIRVRISSDAEQLNQAIEENRDFIQSETLASELTVGPARGDDGESFEMGPFQGRLQIVVERSGD
jgi:isoleucyl-tRNA synthetase